MSVGTFFQETNKKRNFLNPKDNVHVNIPFRIFIPAGQSTFSVPVPRQFDNRNYFFTNAFLISAYYSDQAAALDLDTDEELGVKLVYPTNFKVTFLDPPKDPFFGPFFSPGTGVRTNPEFTFKLNNFFEANKPKGLYRLGAFFDWIDLRFFSSQLTWDQFVRQQSQSYYDQAFDKAKFFNALPVSARSVPGANNYLFPTKPDDVVEEELRFRLNIAPNTAITFSNMQILVDLGFSNEQIPEPNGKGQYVFTNPINDQFLSVPADYQPEGITPAKLGTLKIRLKVHNAVCFSNEDSIELKYSESKKNEFFEKATEDYLKRLADTENIEVFVKYTDALKTFQFTFPDNEKILDATLLVTPAYSERLGFGMVREIATRNRTGEPVNDEIDNKLVQEKSRALAYDTGTVVVTCENETAHMTAGVDSKLMAVLNPTGTGALEILASDLCHEPPTFTFLGSSMRDDDQNVLAKFKLSRFLDNNKLVPLVWKCGAWMNGVMRGVVKTEGQNIYK